MTASPLHRIETDHARFREIVRGRIRGDLRKFLSSGELIGRMGNGVVSIPVPQIELPRFRFGKNEGGSGSGAAGEGDGTGGGEKAEGSSSGPAGDGEGQHLLEVEVDLDELADMLGEELELPGITPRGVRQLKAEAGRYTGVRNAGPDSLRHFRRSYKKALLRTVASGIWNELDPIVIPERDDFRYRARKTAEKPDSAAVVFHMMDVSGSMGREQKEVVRIQAFWIDTWLRRQYKDLEVVYIVHDAVARTVDGHTFFHLRESGGTKISSAYELCRKLIVDQYPPEDWNIYPFHYSDGDNWSARDTELCVRLLEDEILPSVNQFCYSQVKSAHGSGQFKKDLDSAFGSIDELVTASIDGRPGIPDAIRAFLGRGR